MAGSVNKVILIGNVGKDPDIRTTSEGKKIANFTIATSESWKKDGERKERTEWHRVVIFQDALAGIVQQYVKKGSKVYVEGQLQTRSYEKDGHTNYTTEVVLTGFNGTLTMLDGPKERQEQSDFPIAGVSNQMDDEIPF